MTVILLDPRRPLLVPYDTVDLLGGPVEYTEELPVSMRWRLPDARPCGLGERREVLISTDAGHIEVRRRVDLGERVVGAGAVRGGALLEAVEVMRRVRRDGPWEAAQTHASLLRFLVEETWELVDAVARGDADEVRSELGDLLLQVLFHSAIAEEGGEFDVDDVAAGLVRKLAARMPHFFGAGPVPADVAEQERIWNERKAAESVRESCMDGISFGQPALALTEKVVARALAAGLPRECVPESLLRVRIEIAREETDAGADAAAEPTSAELRQRVDVLEFAARVREAEARGRARAAVAAEKWTGITAADWL